MYEYALEFRNTAAHGNTDALGRLPLLVEQAKADTPLSADTEGCPPSTSGPVPPAGMANQG